MDTKYKIAFAHPFREQLARLFTDLPSFELYTNEGKNISQNKKDFAKNYKDISFSQYITEKKSNTSIIQKIQYYIGLVNFRKFSAADDIDLVIANNGFLYTNKPYVLYLEKITAIFGYSAKHYNKIHCKIFLKNRLQDSNLKLIVFRTKTARIGAINTYKKISPSIAKLIEEKSIYSYPPSPYTPNDSILERFKTPEKIVFLFSSGSFILKGGYQLVRAFDKISKEHSNIELKIISKTNTIDSESLKLIHSNKYINIYEPKFTQIELFEKFYLKSHIFIYPTFFDSFGMVINEAMSTYMPIITSDFFAIPERIQNKKNGFLYKTPYKNYNDDWIIHEEKEILEYIYNNKLSPSFEAIEDFLYKKMEFFITSPEKIYTFAQKQKNIYQKNIHDNKAKEELNSKLVSSL